MHGIQTQFTRDSDTIYNDIERINSKTPAIIRTFHLSNIYIARQHRAGNDILVTRYLFLISWFVWQAPDNRLLEGVLLLGTLGGIPQKPDFDMLSSGQVDETSSVGCGMIKWPQLY